MPLRGPLRYSQRSGHLQTRFAQTMQVPSSERCSVAQHGLMAGGYLSARPLRELRPNGSLASLTLRGLGLPHFSRLTSHKGTARRATTTSLLIPTPSLLAQGNHKGCPYALTPHSYGLTPHSSLLTHPYDLTPPHPPQTSQVCAIAFGWPGHAGGCRGWWLLAHWLFPAGASR